ncbi:hypothetical protein FC83_GL000841 [Agrilactobacillus composti DSM 18527 = JCM 14202]|uniref:Uncharacterized protein n=1 Tax=Agrilactobacillus composti DSM 18527 = JCM 14202 TaxID=1423734 RepID=X0QM43_9LACO|nr:cell wall-active antibiotics response protein LiaF [Agrilactobacillus composti]KRM35814.1 hypothetical protein FC83_GL000841 [Agrilactobacillus composti DSM 18527 = JCM 14202]GAF39685.1 transporter associated with VraSR [Agrilactobacillus composti DSM 18527 = JCM 14202]
MSGIWTAFAIVISFVLAILGWQIFNNPGALVLLIIGVILLLHHPKKKAKLPPYQTLGFAKITGAFLVLLALGQNISFWFLLLVFFFFAMIIFGSWRKTKHNLSSYMPWNQKGYVAPTGERQTSDDDITVKQQRWFGDLNIGSQIYTWDDINLTIIAGDTIVDLGNTLLPPDRENVIVLRKSFGRTRILVPVGTKVRINHCALFGKLKLDDQTYDLRNESITMTLNNEEDNRELRIITSVWIGDLEVIYV